MTNTINPQGLSLDMEQAPPAVPCITFINWSGDVTITWKPEREAEIREVVEQMMAKKFRFFIIKPRLLRFGSKQVPLTSVDQLKSAKGLVVPDEALSAFAQGSRSFKGVQDDIVAAAIANGAAHSVRIADDSRDCTQIGLAITADQVLQSQTLAVRPVVGG